MNLDYKTYKIFKTANIVMIKYNILPDDAIIADTYIICIELGLPIDEVIHAHWIHDVIKHLAGNHLLLLCKLHM